MNTDKKEQTIGYVLLIDLGTELERHDYEPWLGTGLVDIEHRTYRNPDWPKSLGEADHLFQSRSLAIKPWYEDAQIQEIQAVQEEHNFLRLLVTITHPIRMPDQTVKSETYAVPVTYSGRYYIERFKKDVDVQTHQ